MTAMKHAKRHFRVVLFIWVLALFLPARIYVAQESAPQLPTAAKPCSSDFQPQEEMRLKLPPNALQVARVIGVDCDLARLSQLTTSESAAQGRVRSLEELSLRQEITDTVVTASLDVDSVLNEIDYEQRQIYELIRISQTRHDRALGTTNLAVLTVSTGLGIVAGALSFSDITSDLGDVLGFASGGISTLFSVRGLRQTKEKGHAEGVLPSMLGPFFADPAAQQRLYAEAAWTYLNSVPPGKSEELSRRAQLLEQWESKGRLQVPGSVRSQQRIMLFTTTQPSTKSWTWRY